MSIIFDSKGARTEGWNETLSKRDLVEIVRQQDERIAQLEAENKDIRFGIEQKTLTYNEGRCDAVRDAVRELTLYLENDHASDVTQAFERSIDVVEACARGCEPKEAPEK